MSTRRVGNLLNTGFTAAPTTSPTNSAPVTTGAFAPFVPPGATPIAVTNPIAQSPSIPYTNRPFPFFGSGPNVLPPPPFGYQDDTIEAIPVSSLNNEELDGDFDYGCDDGVLFNEEWNCGESESSSCSTDSECNGEFMEDDLSSNCSDDNNACNVVECDDNFCCIEEESTSALCCEESQVCSTSNIQPCRSTSSLCPCPTSSDDSSSSTCPTNSECPCPTSSDCPCSESSCQSKSSCSTALAKINNDTLKILVSGSVLDLCSYDNHYFVLLANGDIEKYNQQWKKIDVIKQNLPLKFLDVFGGYIYATTDNELFKLDNKTYSSSNWNWVSVNKYIAIASMQATLNGEILYLSMGSDGYLYTIGNDPLKLNILETVKVPDDHIRVYGLDDKHYLQINYKLHMAKKFPSKDMVHDILSGALNYNDEVVKILPSQKCQIKSVKIVDWEPYYIIYP